MKIAQFGPYPPPYGEISIHIKSIETLLKDDDHKVSLFKNIAGFTIALRGGFRGSEDKFWSYDPINYELPLSFYYLNEKTLPSYLEKILEFRSKYLHAYASLVVLFPDLLIENRMIGDLRFDVILLVSENICDWQIRKLKLVFPDSLVFGWYGHLEQLILASWCENTYNYHDWPFYVFTEILSPDSKPVKLDTQGELVRTSLWNYATPFIRYKSLDHVFYSGIGCNKCNRQFKLFIEIIARQNNYLITINGKKLPVPITSIHDDLLINVKKFQFFQITTGEVYLKIGPKNSFNEADTFIITDNVKRKLESGIDLKFEFIEEFERINMGKYKFVAQRLI